MSGIRDIAKGAGVKPDVVSDVFEEIFRRIRKGENVTVIGFGSFTMKSFPGATRTSPVINGGEPFTFEKKRRISFNCSDGAKKRLNAKRKKKATKKVVAKKVKKTPKKKAKA